ncbi:MAG TPA: glycosyltransferase family 2 protein [Acidimicrobiia bacterium]|nr:glycosyltransferase family 2 protein [Acidimicrobiia bacterium]
MICAYTERRWDDILDCVASLRAQTCAPDEILLVIDHNPELFRRATDEFVGVLVVENLHARGLSGARNTAIAIATGDVVAFIDDDGAAAPTWCERLLAAFREPNVMVVGGSAAPRWDGAAPRWFPSEFHWVVGCSWTGLPESAVAVRNVIGCNMAFRRDVFATVGLFRTGVGRIGTNPVGCEETELCIRIHQQIPGAIVKYDPSIAITHHVTGERRTSRYFFRRCWAEGYSKAQISRTVGARDATQSERAYALRTLPRGIVAGIASIFGRSDRSGAARAAMIIGGGVTTATSYSIHRFRRSDRVEVSSTVAEAAEAA